MNENTSAALPVVGAVTGEPKPSAAKTMAAFARLGAVMKALQLLEAEGVTAPGSVEKGVRKFVKDNPAINEHFAREAARHEQGTPS